MVEEQVMTATAKFADIVLPVNTYMEREDLTFGDGLVYIGKQNKVIEPLGESKSPLQITAELDDIEKRFRAVEDLLQHLAIKNS